MPKEVKNQHFSIHFFFIGLVLSIFPKQTSGLNLSENDLKMFIVATNYFTNETKAFRFCKECTNFLPFNHRKGNKKVLTKNSQKYFLLKKKKKSVDFSKN